MSTPPASAYIRQKLGSRRRGTLDPRLADLYERYRSAVYARCLRLLSHQGDAEDALQEVFVRVAENLDKTPDGLGALPWLQRIATNHCLNELRSRRRGEQPGYPASKEQAFAGGESAMADLDLAQRLMRRLPNHLGTSAWLLHVEGLTHDEVGQALGLSRRTIFNYIAEAQTRARTFVEQRDHV